MRNLPKPILVTGSHRSGTTWVGKMLAASPATRYVHEPFNVDLQACACGVRLPHWYEYITARSPRAPEFRPHLRHAIYPYCDLRESEVSMDAATKKVLAKVRRIVSSTRPIVKDPLALLSAEWLARTFSMDVVVMIRHPAAVASSLKRLGWEFSFRNLLDQPALMREHFGPFRSEIAAFARRRRDIVDQAGLLWKVLHAMILGYRERRRWSFIRHEDLSRDPLGGFESLFGALSLPYGRAARRAVAEHSDDGNSNAEAPHDEVRRASRANIWVWRSRLSPAEIRRVRARVEEVSSHFYGDADWEPPSLGG